MRSGRITMIDLVRAAVMVVGFCLALIGQAVAGESGGVPLPQPPKGRGDVCVADTDFMRRNHMVMLKHQRDETVHKGIRTKQFSLKNCIECHAVEGPDARPVDISSPQHFCRACHDYAAVRPDCFECHASTPERDAPQARGMDSDFATLSTRARGNTK